jgi:DNA-binding transcriptional regulator WhiA
LNEIKTNYEIEISTLKEEQKNTLTEMENNYKSNLKSTQERNDRMINSTTGIRDLIDSINTANDLNECYLSDTIPKSIQKILKDGE